MRLPGIFHTLHVVQAVPDTPCPHEQMSVVCPLARVSTVHTAVHITAPTNVFAPPARSSAPPLTSYPPLPPRSPLQYYTIHNRSAGIGSAGPRARQEPPEPAALRLASMIALLPGVHGSCISEGPASGAVGAVVALVDAKKAEVGSSGWLFRRQKGNMLYILMRAWAGGRGGGGGARVYISSRARRAFGAVGCCCCPFGL